MAVVTCKECGSAVSNKAKACPACGAPVPKNVGFFGVLFALFLGFVIFVTVRMSPLAPKPVREDLEFAALTPASVAGETARGWRYSSENDRMSGKAIEYAETTSLNKNDLHWPYGPGIAARLILRKHPRMGKDVMVVIDKGQILCRSYEACTLVARFDSNAPAKFSGIGPSDGSSNTVFIRNYARTVAELKRSKNVRLELPIYQDGQQSWEFETTGLSW